MALWVVHMNDSNRMYDGARLSINQSLAGKISH